MKLLVRQNCLPDFQTSQTEATLTSHHPTDSPYFEHWTIKMSTSTHAGPWLKPITQLVACLNSFVTTYGLSWLNPFDTDQKIFDSLSPITSVTKSV